MFYYVFDVDGLDQSSGSSLFLPFFFFFAKLNPFGRNVLAKTALIVQAIYKCPVGAAP